MYAEQRFLFTTFFKVTIKNGFSGGPKPVDVRITSNTNWPQKHPEKSWFILCTIFTVKKWQINSKFKNWSERYFQNQTSNNCHEFWCSSLRWKQMPLFFFKPGERVIADIYCNVLRYHTIFCHGWRLITRMASISGHRMGVLCHMAKKVYKFCKAKNFFLARCWLAFLQRWPEPAGPRNVECFRAGHQQDLPLLQTPSSLSSLRGGLRCPMMSSSRATQLFGVGPRLLSQIWQLNLMK